MIKALIIDDEPDSTELLRMQLQHNCPGVEVVEVFHSAVKALDAIEKINPDLIFLDIEMPVMNGFELLARLPGLQSSIIFITAYNQFAIKAFKFNAVDYLVKPVDTTELINAVERVPLKTLPDPAQMNNLQKQLGGEPISRIAIPHAKSIVFVELDDVLYAEAKNNYTKLLLINGTGYTISKTLGDVQEVLEERQFLRVHRQFIINLKKIKQLYRGDNMYVVMDDGTNIPVARTQKEKLVERFSWL